MLIQYDEQGKHHLHTLVYAFDQVTMQLSDLALSRLFIENHLEVRGPFYFCYSITCFKVSNLMFAFFTMLTHFM